METETIFLFVGSIRRSKPTTQWDCSTCLGTLTYVDNDNGGFPESLSTYSLIKITSLLRNLNFSISISLLGLPHKIP